MESPTESVTWRSPTSCAIEHGKETQKYYLPSQIMVSGKRTNLTAGVSGPLLLREELPVVRAPDNPSPPTLQPGAAGGTSPRATKLCHTTP